LNKNSIKTLFTEGKLNHKNKRSHIISEI